MTPINNVRPLFIPQTVSIGAYSLAQKVTELHSRCPVTTVLLGGYSQGALVVGYATAILDQGSLGASSEYVDSILLFGDPFLNPQDIVVSGSLVTSDPVYLLRNGISGRRSLWAQTTPQIHVESVCHQADIVCGGRISDAIMDPFDVYLAIRNGFYPHESYDDQIPNVMGLSRDTDLVAQSAFIWLDGQE